MLAVSALLAVLAAQPMKLGYEYDITREKVPTPETIRRVVDIVAGLGYGQLQLYFKDNFAYTGHEAVWGDRDHLTAQEMKDLDRYCVSKGIELIPYQSSFGHLEPWFARTNYLHLAECPKGTFYVPEFKRDFNTAALCATSPESIRFIDGLFDELFPCFSSKYVNLGCDEVWDLHATDGRSLPEILKRGRGQVYCDFILKLRDSVNRRGRTMMFWSDIIRNYPELVQTLPSDIVALDWNYEDDDSFEKTTPDLKKAPCRFYTCPGTSSWCSFWGRHANMRGNVRRAWTEGRRNGAEGLLLTDWGDNGYPQPWIVSLPALVYTAALVKEGTELSDEEIARRVDAICGCRCGASLIRAGNAYRKIGTNLANGTPLYRFCCSPAMTRTKAWFRQDEFEAAVAELRAAAKLRDLAGAPDWVRDDLALSDLLVEFLDRRVRGDDRDLRPVFAEEYGRLWNRQNRPKGLAASLKKVFRPTVQFDFGGTTFDFESRSDELFHIPMPGDEGNFVTAGEWKPGESKKADGARIRTWSRVVPLPSKEGGAFTVSFRYKSRHSDLEKSYILVSFRNRKAGTDEWEEARGFASNGGSYYGWPLTDDFADWNVYTKTFGVKPGCEALELVFRTDGAGELEFKDVGLAVAKDEAATERLTLSPHGLLDGRFEVSEGQCGAIGFNWKHDEKKPYDRARTTFRLTLPRGFDFLGTSFGDPKTIRTDRKPDGSSVTEFTAGLGFDPRWANFCRMTALVKSTAVAGTEGKARLEATADGRPVATAAEFVLGTSPAISVRLPKRFMNGVFPSGTSVFFGGGAADRAFAEFMAACGVQWLVTDKCTRDLVDVWHAAGIRRVTPEITMSNGYFMGGDIALRPETDRFRFGPTDEDWRMGHDSYISRGMCPLAIIEERPFFVTNCVVKSIDARMCGADGAWANWEPYMFATRGCICERCRAAFAEWSAKTGGTLKDFRSLQHAKVMRTIDKYVRRTPGGGSLGVIPGVSWRELCSRWREDPPSPESKAQDYAGSLGWINPWGPYFGWNPESPYAYRKNGALAHFVAAKDIRGQVDRDFAPGARPKLLSFPHGLQGSDWVTQPEHLAMALDSFFFNRWDANVIYFFPQGYDARYWRAFAGSVTRTAKFEDFVIDGRRIDERVTLEPVAEYAAPCSVVTTYLPQYRDVSPLQHAAYALKGRMIVAALNFWDKGEAFFSLKVAGLKEGSYEIVDEEGLRYSKSETEPGWSEADLVRGVRLVVGAARTRVFTLAPVGTQKAVSTLSAATLEDLYAARKPRLSAVVAADRRYEAANRVTKDTQAEL